MRAVPYTPREPARRPRPRRPGFTLVEMMIVVTIVGIVAVLAAPMMGSPDTNKLRSAAQLLVADLEYAQAESITHSSATRVLVVNNTTTYTLATAATSSVAITNPVGKLPYVTTFGTGRAASLDGVTISAYSLNGDAIIGFGAYGQLDQTANATITLRSGGNTVMVTLDATTGMATVGAIQ
ncbi:MAG: prepilin-type N-terminal cleavage/methylation domain-containing protein [Planctomycetes bacterium]|nr:prepilin-type N-terminal cleavage/methylation domain-containing protein [Planctomycetota bacterium]